MSRPTKLFGATMLAVLLCSAFFLAVDGVNQTTGRADHHTGLPAPPSVLVSNQTVNGKDKSAGQQLLDAVPDGGTITFAELEQKVGPEVAELFRWAKPKNISRIGNRFVVECDPGATATANGITLKPAEKIEADLTVYPDGIGLSGVKGATVSFGNFNLLKVREVRIQRDGTDKVKVSGRAEISRFLPYVPFSVTLSEDDLKQ